MASLTFLGHATVVLDLGGVRVITDPVLRQRVTFLRRYAPAVPTIPDVDAVLISHLHHDHCDLPSLRLLGPDTPIVAPAGSGDFLRRNGFRRTVTLRPGEDRSIGQATVTATPAAHDGRRTPFGPHAAAVGYLITTHEVSVYFAGDTDLFAAMAGLHPDLDLALLPVAGWGPTLGPGHLDPARAAQAVGLLRPRHAVPVHWGTLFPLGMTPFYRARLSRPADDFAAAVAARGLPTRVHIVLPGGELTWQ